MIAKVKEGYTKRYLFCWFALNQQNKWLDWLRLSKSKARSQEDHLVLLREWQGPNNMDQVLLLSQVTRQELNWKWSSWCSNWQDGMPEFQVVALPTMIYCQLHILSIHFIITSVILHHCFNPTKRLCLEKIPNCFLQALCVYFFAKQNEPSEVGGEKRVQHTNSQLKEPEKISLKIQQSQESNFSVQKTLDQFILDGLEGKIILMTSLIFRIYIIVMNNMF